MTAALIELETADLAAAARAVVLHGGEPMAAAVRRLWSGLADCAGMAGGDPGGAAWAAAYDRSAPAAVNAAVAAVQGVGHLARLFAQTARNYDAADAASTPAGRRRMDAAVASLPCEPEFWLGGCVPPSAAGPSGGGPPGWALVQDAVGYVWPNGHQDRLRHAARAWRHTARALREGGQAVIDAPLRVIGHQLPESADMWTVCSAACGHLRELADVHDAIAASCEELAQHIDDVHRTVVGELRSLLEWTAGIQAAGGLLSVVTFGVSEVPAQAAEAARVSRTAAVVAGVISRFGEAARSLAASVGMAAERAGELGARLRALLEVPLLEPTLVGAGPVRMLSAAKEVRAAGRLAEDAELFVPLRYIDDPKRFDPEVLRGMRMEDVRAAIPKSWVCRPSGRGGGVVYEDPVNYGRRFRFMPGYPRGARPGAVNEGPYLVVSQNGAKVKVALAGNPELP